MEKTKTFTITAAFTLKSPPVNCLNAKTGPVFVMPKTPLVRKHVSTCLCVVQRTGTEINIVGISAYKMSCSEA